MTDLERLQEDFPDLSAELIAGIYHSYGDDYERVKSFFELYLEAKANERHTCANCKHDHDEWFEEACDTCSKANNHWEPKSMDEESASILAAMVFGFGMGLDVIKGENIDIKSLLADRPQGEWIHERLEADGAKMTDLFLPLCQCSECFIYVEQESNYCPNCGAKMKGTDDDRSKIQ